MVELRKVMLTFSLFVNGVDDLVVFFLINFTGIVIGQTNWGFHSYVQYELCVVTVVLSIKVAGSGCAEKPNKNIQDWWKWAVSDQL